MEDYLEGVVAEYLRADPAMFVRPQCCIQLRPGPHRSAGQHWYCDLVAVRFREPRTVFLCEVTIARTPTALFNRLRAWSEQWPAVRDALARDNSIPASWAVQPWVFVRGDRRAFVARKLADILSSHSGLEGMPAPLVTSLDDVTPWRYEAPLQLPPRDEAKE